MGWANNTIIDFIQMEAVVGTKQANSYRSTQLLALKSIDFGNDLGPYFLRNQYHYKPPYDH